MRQQKMSESTPEKQSKLQSFLLRIEEKGFVLDLRVSIQALRT
jgi:hypothetical protein